MASTPEVLFDDVSSRYLEGDLTTLFTLEQIETQIADAVDYAAGRWGSVIESRISGGQLKANYYKRIIANAVLRVLRNPEGYTTEREGDYAYGLRSSVASGDLWFTPEEIAALSGAGQMTVPGTVGIGLDRGWS